MHSAKNRLFAKHGHICEVTSGWDDLIMYQDSSHILTQIKRQWIRFRMASELNNRCSLYLKSQKAIDAEHRRHLNYLHIIHPFSDLRKCWELFMVFVFVMVFVLIPLDLASASSELQGNLNDNSFWQWVRTLFDLFCLSDIVVNFYSGYYDYKTRSVIMQPKTIVLRYLFTYFVPDLLSSIPYHRDIFYLQRLTQRRRQIKFILRCTSLLKVTRCITLYAYSKHSVEAYDLNFTRYRVILSLIIFVAQFHFFTCLNIAYIGVATYNVFGNKQRNRTFTMMYSRMFFETTHVLLASKVGFSHQRIGYLGQKLVVGVCWIISRIIFFYVISQLITIISSVRASNIKYRQMVRQLHEYMRYRQLPENLQRRLILYYEFRFERSYFKESEILNYVSEQLRQEILLHGCRKLVENVEFFRNLPLPLIIRIVSALKPDVYMVNDVIIKVNTQPVCMYFIASGCVAIYTKGGQEVCHLEDGNFFGEIGLVTEQLRLASVVAVETSELYRLNEQDFIRAILPYPDLIDKIKKIAFERTEQTMFIEERSILQKKIFRTITERAQY